jgi:hypothetical protein
MPKQNASVSISAKKMSATTKKRRVMFASDLEHIALRVFQSSLDRPRKLKGILKKSSYLKKKKVTKQNANSSKKSD